jgi:hypothetical protein
MEKPEHVDNGYPCTDNLPFHSLLVNTRAFLLYKKSCNNATLLVKNT